MEFIENAKKEMEALLDRLYEIDPSWKRCSPCISKGKCCEGANPGFSEVEKNLIIDNIKLCQDDLEKLKQNLDSRSICPFHLPDKCIIHEYRSMNCRWTPYYVAVDNEGIVRYFKINSKCQFEKVEVPKHKLQFKVFEEHYVWLPHFDGLMHCHILLSTLNFLRNGYSWDIPATEVCKQILLSKKGAIDADKG